MLLESLDETRHLNLGSFHGIRGSKHLLQVRTVLLSIFDLRCEGFCSCWHCLSSSAQFFATWLLSCMKLQRFPCRFGCVSTRISHGSASFWGVCSKYFNDGQIPHLNHSRAHHRYIKLQHSQNSNRFTIEAVTGASLDTGRTDSLANLTVWPGRTDRCHAQSCCDDSVHVGGCHGTC